MKEEYLIDDDGITPKEQLNVVKAITPDEPVPVETSLGTLAEVQRSLDDAYRERDRLNAMIENWEAQRAEIQVQLDKLPEREEPVEEPPQ